MLLNGEGMLSLHRSLSRGADPDAHAAGRGAGVAPREPVRYRLAADGQVPLRAGYLASVEGATTLATAFIRQLDGSPT